MESEGTTHSLESLHSISDDDLLRRLGELVSRSRRVEVDLVSHVGEVDERKLYAREASPSMFAYCTLALHLSEAEAYLRIRVARAAREHPQLLTMLGDGRLHLSGIAKLVPVLTRDNRGVLLQRATHRSKRQILELVAELSPRPDAPSVVRKLPQRRHTATLSATRSLDQAEICALELGPDAVATDPTPAVDQSSDRSGAKAIELGPDAVEASPSTTRDAGLGIAALGAKQAAVLVGGLAKHSPSPAAPSRPAVVEPLAPARYRVQFTASAEFHDKLERLRALMRREVPDGDLAAIIDQAVTEKLERIEARRYARTSAPRKELRGTDTAPTSRHIPAAVRRAVRERDGDRCGYVDERGRRCTEPDRLEFHHQHPFAMGGDHSPSSLHLLCPSHNRYLAEVDYGRATIRRRSAKGPFVLAASSPPD